MSCAVIPVSQHCTGGNGLRSSPQQQRGNGVFAMIPLTSPSHLYSGIVQLSSLEKLWHGHCIGAGGCSCLPVQWLAKLSYRERPCLTRYVTRREATSSWWYLVWSYCLYSS